ncbi:MAG: diaminopimelate epimerase [Gemmatimonadaceae bacterium]
MTGHFWKMSGSGNDFVFADLRSDAAARRRWAEPSFVEGLCTPHTGVGADGVAIIEPSATADFRLRYLNRDGSQGELCGNASLCATRLASHLGIASAGGMRFETEAGLISGRIHDGLPQVDLQPPQGLLTDAGISRHLGEERIGYVNTGVPHLVILTSDLSLIDLGERGPELRYHESLPAGANVNWIAPEAEGGWQMRTYERGVEAETLACGTGAVACALMLSAWGETTPGSPTSIRTKSGRHLVVTTRAQEGRTIPSLAGEGRIVFEGELREL